MTSMTQRYMIKKYQVKTAVKAFLSVVIQHLAWGGMKDLVFPLPTLFPPLVNFACKLFTQQHVFAINWTSKLSDNMPWKIAKFQRFKSKTIIEWLSRTSAWLWLTNKSLLELRSHKSEMGTGFIFALHSNTKSWEGIDLYGHGMRGWREFGINIFHVESRE